MEFRKVESFGPAEMSRFSTASLITRSTNDITQIQMFITMGLMMIVKSPIMAVWAVCKIAGDGLEWTLATGIAVVVLLVSITILMVLVMPKFKSMQRLTDNINLVARENLTGLRVVRATMPRITRKPSSPRPTRNSPTPSCSPTVPWPS